MISLPPSWLQAGETGNFLMQTQTHMYERRKPEDAAQAHHTTAAIQNACRRRNTGTSHSRGTLSEMAWQKNNQIGEHYVRSH
jgi:hypothetical protein